MKITDGMKAAHQTNISIEWVAKIVRIFAIIIVSIILLNVILFIVFTIPAVQKGVADVALEKFRPDRKSVV